jgi:hypothetical protein
MGVLGCPEFYKWNHQFESNELFFSNVSVNFFYHGIDWLYTTVQTVYSYDFRVWYFWFFNSIYDDSFDFFFSSFWYFNLSVSAFQLFWAVILDQYVTTMLYKLPYTEEWFRSMLSSKEATLVLIYHPELSFVKEEIFQEYYVSYFGNLVFSLYDLVESETFLTPIILFPQLLFLVFLATLFISFYFSYFSSATNEESVVDTDYLAASATVEAEKEISSFDDMILAFVVLFYIFGWYFYIHCWSILSMMPELVLVFYLFPGLYYIIIGIPTFLIYDFGIYFLAYLRGVGATSLFIYELMFDYIAVIIFYTRILVQGVRLVLMISTYASMHDVVLFFSFGQKMFLGAETFWEEFNNVSITLDSMSYFFLFTVPGKFIYWIYEILHTFFVVTVQFAAFFAIVFWLFLFLYTFFVIEKQENYFTEKRAFRKKLYTYLYNLK